MNIDELISTLTAFRERMNDTQRESPVFVSIGHTSAGVIGVGFDEGGYLEVRGDGDE